MKSSVIFSKADRKKKAAEMAARFIRSIKHLLQGVHIMPLGWTDIVPEILKQSEIDIRQSAFNWRMA